MAGPATYKHILAKFESCPDNIKQYFDSVPSLIEGYAYEVTIAYLYLMLERVQHTTLYCGVVKIHKVDAEIADRVINSQHMLRSDFQKFYENVFGKTMSPSTKNTLLHAEKVRNKVVHGKSVKAADMRQAISDIFDYAEALDNEVYQLAGTRPLGDLRGFKGRACPLDKTTSKWLMKGLGFAV